MVIMLHNVKYRINYVASAIYEIQKQIWYEIFKSKMQMIHE